MNKLLLLMVAGSLALVSCSKDDDEGTTGPTPTTNTTSSFSLNASGLGDLGPDFMYEGWIIVDGSPVSTGLFSVDANGDLSQTTFEVLTAQLAAATKFVISIEPNPDTDPAPSDTKILAGDFNGNDATLSVGDGAALGDDLMAASGTYIVATPTTSAMDDELSGIWFLDNSSGSPAAGLDLPTLPAGWAYEGWAVIDGTPVSTGRFTDGSVADAFADFSGTDNPGPPFPGEDFINNAPAGVSFPTDLSGGAAVISIEPDPDNSAAPFELKPLFGSIPSPATPMTAYNMDNNAAATNPTGSVSR